MSKNVEVSIKFYVYSSVKIILLNVMTVFILQLVLVQDMTQHFILRYLFYSTFLPSLLSYSFPDTLQEDSGLEHDK